MVAGQMSLVEEYRVIGWMGHRVGALTLKRARREFWGLGSILALTGSGCSLGKILQLWMTARA